MTDAGSEYVAFAAARIVDLLHTELAVVHPELEARLAEGYYREARRSNIDPHHITTALRQLFEAGTIISTDATTRGGRKVPTITLTDQTGRKTRTDDAAQRKRLLLARYHGWAQGTQRDPHGLIGPAGELAVRGAILQTGTIIPAKPQAGEVKQLLGVTLPGALDSAGHMLPVVNGVPQPQDNAGTPRPTITDLFEVKNIRSWIYPSSAELYQLLNKATILQTAQPNVQIVPILVCRRAHRTTFFMAKQLGFVVIEIESQFAGPVDAKALDEVRNELAFTDLRTGTGPSARVTERLTTSNLPGLMPEMAAAWQATALDPATAQHLARLGSSKTTPRQRLQLLESLRDIAKARGFRGGW